MGDPSDETTVVETIASLRRDGFGEDFSVTPEGRISCRGCHGVHEPADAVVERAVRVEGMTDPDDEAAVFGLRCRHCGARGVLVTAYGPSASAEEARVLAALTS